jgi:hypothetical protein
MEDSHRHLEQEALRNVRALVDKLEGDELAKNRRQWRWQLLLFVPIGLILAGVGVSAWLQPSKSGEIRQRSCELDAWNTRAAAFERDARRANPEESARDIQNRLRRERPSLMAEAKAQCDAGSRHDPRN